VPLVPGPADLLRRYRATGADLPLGDPRRAHGVAMEGYFWRFTDPVGGRVLVALIGVNRGPSGPWATLGHAAHPGRHLRVAARPGAWAAPDGLAAGCGSAFTGAHDRLEIDLAADARVSVRVEDHAPWSRRRWGGSSVFHVVPALNQYWHPWLLGGRAHGTAVVGGDTWELDGWDVYGEKNWGRGGFPDTWWWGQAQGFADRRACVAFAGGPVHAGPLRATVTGLVVRLPDGRLLRLGDPVVSPVRARVDERSWLLRGRGFGWEVEVEADAEPTAAHVLPVPLPDRGVNTAGALEHLAGRMEVRVRRRGRTAWRGTSVLAGLERGGLALADAELRRRGAAPGSVGAPPA
jgi:hypothetical protein